MSDLTNTLLATANINREETFVEDHFRTYLYVASGTATDFDDVGINFSGFEGGSVEFDGTGDYLSVPSSSDFSLDGDFTIEMWLYRAAAGNNYFFTLGDSFTATGLEAYIGSSGSALNVYSNGVAEITSATVPSVSTWAHLAVVRSGTTITLYLDGVSLGTWTSVSTTFSGDLYIGAEFYNSSITGVMNGYISNFRIVKGTAVYTTGFTPPSVALAKVAGTSILTALGTTPLIDQSFSSHTITTNGDASPSAFGPFANDRLGGLVWFKGRNRAGSSFGNRLYDTVRGDKLELNTEGTGGQASQGQGLTTFNANGFSIGTDNDINTGTNWHVAWSFGIKKGFFDIVEYTGTGSNTAISHGLSDNPGAIITKRTDTTGDWTVWHKDLPAGSVAQLHTNAPKLTAKLDAFYQTPTKDQFFLGDDTDVNTSGGTYISYIFGSDESNNVKGDGIVHCGTYTGTGNNVYQTVDDCGWEPYWLLIKNVDTTSDWIIVDQSRGWGIGDPADGQEDRQQWFLYPNSNTLEINATLDTVHVDPRGIRVRGELNRSGDQYIYIAIRRGPMRTPTADTVEHYYQTYTYTGNGTTGTKITNPGARQRNDFAFYTDLDQTSTSWSSYNHPVQSRITGADKKAFTNSFAGTQFGSGWYSFGDFMAVNYGLELPSNYINDSGTDYVVHSFTRAPGFFDIVTWIGDGTRDRQIPHNLQTIPSLYLVKAVTATASSVEYWMAYTTNQFYIGTNYNEQTAYALGYSDAQNFFSAGDFWGTKPATASHIRVGDDNDFQLASVNEDGVVYSAFLWGDNITGVIRNSSMSFINDDGPINFPAEVVAANGRNVGQPRFILWKSFNGVDPGANTPWLTFSDGLGLANTGTSTMINWGEANVDFNTSFINTTANGFQLNISANNVILSNVQSYIYMSIG